MVIFRNVSAEVLVALHCWMNRDVADVIKSCTGYCYGVVSYKASHALQPLSDLLCFPVWVLIIPNSSTRALWLQQRQRSKQLARNALELTDMVSLSYSAGIFNTPEILRHAADYFTPLPKEVIFLSLLKVTAYLANFSLDSWKSFTWFIQDTEVASTAVVTVEVVLVVVMVQ
jgi:hypothetical protein